MEAKREQPFRKKKWNQAKTTSRPGGAAGHENNWTREASELQLPPSTVLSGADMVAVKRLTSCAPWTHRFQRPGSLSRAASVMGFGHLGENAITQGVNGPSDGLLPLIDTGFLRGYLNERTPVDLWLITQPAAGSQLVAQMDGDVRGDRCSRRRSFCFSPPPHNPLFGSASEIKTLVVTLVLGPIRAGRMRTRERIQATIMITWVKMNSILYWLWWLKGSGLKKKMATAIQSSSRCSLYNLVIIPFTVNR